MNQLVVARWQEDMSWGVRSPWPLHVVQKDRDVPNFGREASSYFHWLATAEVDPAATYGFCQGDPWPHCFAFDQLRPVNEYTPMGVHVLTERADGAPNHPGLPLVQCLREWLGYTGEDPAGFRTIAGAQFLIPGRLILQRPREWYAEMVGVVSRHQAGPWVMERLWPYVWPAGPPV